jgi:hypothetical protein
MLFVLSHSINAALEAACMIGLILAAMAVQVNFYQYVLKKPGGTAFA